MNPRRLFFLPLVCAGLAALAPRPCVAQGYDPLPSWNPTPTRDILIEFVERVTLPGPDHVEPADRVAVFDLDGTLICENPDYLTTLVTHAHLQDRLASDPTRAEHPVYRAIRDHDDAYLRKNYKEVHLEAFADQSHADLHAATARLMETQQHPVFHRPYREMVYQPMLELVRYLQTNDFKVYVVSASMQEFIRAFSEPVLGIPRENVVGSAVAFSVEKNGRVVRRRAWLEPYSLDEGKAVRILERIGRAPILACGNGNGDVDMLRLAASNPLPHLSLVLDHDDRERDMYDRKPFLLKIAESETWPIIKVSTDFRSVFPPKPADLAVPPPKPTPEPAAAR